MPRTPSAGGAVRLRGGSLAPAVRIQGRSSSSSGGGGGGGSLGSRDGMGERADRHYRHQQQQPTRTSSSSSHIPRDAASRAGSRGHTGSSRFERHQRDEPAELADAMPSPSDISSPDSGASSSASDISPRRRSASSSATPDSGAASVTVAVRCRPLPPHEAGDPQNLAVKMMKGTVIVQQPQGGGFSTGQPQPGQQHTFTFDKAFWSVPSQASINGYATQDQVYRDVGQPILTNALKGYNCCILAYGQTGSGKSYSMFGAEDSSPAYISKKRHSKKHSGDSESVGIVPRLVEDLYEHIRTRPDRHFTVEISFYQIYLEKATCLLSPKQGVLKVREHPLTGPYVEDLTSCLCESRKSMMKVIQEGNRSRRVAHTNQNAVSSRSHAVISITLSQQLKSGPAMTTTSKISLIDLAGSERISKSGSSGVGFMEASTINKSLSILGKVISTLAGKAYKKNKNSVHVPYRDSILTWLLRESLGGNSKTVMLATVSSSLSDREESLSTLRYADQAKRIVNKAVINEGTTKRIVQQLKCEIRFLQEQLYKGADLVLQQKLVQSQKLMEQMTKTWDEKWTSTQALLREKELVAHKLQQENQTMSKEIKRMSEELSKAQSAQAEADKVRREYQRLQNELSGKCEEVAYLTGRTSSMSSLMTSSKASTASTPPGTPRLDERDLRGGAMPRGAYRQTLRGYSPSSRPTGSAAGHSSRPPTHATRRDRSPPPSPSDSAASDSTDMASELREGQGRGDRGDLARAPQPSLRGIPSLRPPLPAGSHTLGSRVPRPSLAGEAREGLQARSSSTGSSRSSFFDQPRPSSPFPTKRGANGGSSFLSQPAAQQAAKPRDAQREEEDLRWKKWLENKRMGRPSTPVPRHGASSAAPRAALNSSGSPAVGAGHTPRPSSISSTPVSSRTARVPSPASYTRSADREQARSAPEKEVHAVHQDPMRGAGQGRGAAEEEVPVRRQGREGGEPGRWVDGRDGERGGGRAKRRDRDRECDSASDSGSDSGRDDIKRATASNTKDAIRLSEAARKRIDDDYRRQKLGLAPLHKTPSKPLSSRSLQTVSFSSSPPVLIAST